MSSKPWVVINDLHCGCQMGLCLPRNKMDGGGVYTPNNVQKKIASYWREWWEKWVPRFCEGRFGVVINGDVVDGVHHRSTHQWTHNMKDQGRCAYELLAPVCHQAEELYVIRGTEAHDGISGEEAEALAEKLGAKKDEAGNHARFELWLKIGSGLVHALHHIGTTGSSAYESTAVHKELTEAFQEAGRWGERPPDMIVRAHRHRYLKTEVSSEHGSATAVVVPGWQAKTPFAWRIPGARQAPPQFGGIVIREGSDADGDLYVRRKVWTIGRGRVES